MRILLRNFLFVAFALLPVLASAQGVTTSSIFGKLVDATSGDPLIGATVQAVHTPSGTSYGNATDLDGFFRIPGMRVGGPYTITATYVGFEPVVQEGVYLSLGQAYEFSPDLGEAAINLESITVTSSRSDLFNGDKTGAETTVTEEQIDVLPTVARAVGDYARLTPQATVNEGNDGFSISVGGMNNRYNAFYVDGAVSNDVFGLSGSGFNGGQTGVSPISVDAIESFQINIAPFDVRVAGFAGAAISAITRSGSNNIEASVYGFFRNQNTIATELEGAGVSPFTAHTEGFRIGGPIVKNKAFFFVNYERQREETPLPFDSGDYIGDTPLDSIDLLAGFLQNEYGYDAGTYTDNQRFLNSEKLTTRFDLNLSDKHKLALRLNYVNADNLEGVQSNPRAIRFLNASERFVAQTYSASLEVNSLLSNSLSNSLTIGFTAQRDDRDPNGDPFPRVSIRDGAGTITFGGEPFSSANLLNQDVLSINDNLEIYKGKHAITIGTNLEFYRAENLFIARNYGDYQFNNVSDFLTGERPRQFSRGYSLVDNLTGDDSQAIAAFNAGTAGLYVQDKIQVNNKFSLTLGLRADLPFYEDTPTNDVFNETTIPLIEAAEYDLRGASVGNFIKPQLLLSPRLGFNYDIKGDKTAQMRGGIGIFTSRAPLVWVGGAFNNYGQNVGSVFLREDFAEVPAFTPDVNGQFPGNVDVNNAPQGGQIDLFAEDFKLPQFLKANLAIDKKLPLGFIGTIDLLFNKTLQNVAYQNVNVRPAELNLDGAGGMDTRPLYNRGDEVDDTYDRIILGYNTSEGYAYNFTATLARPFSNGFFAQLSYSYGDAYAVFDGTSSQNSSQWRGLNSVGGRNFDQPLTRSDFAAGHRFTGSVSYRLNGPEGWGTTLTLFSETRQNGPYSLIYDNGEDIGNEDSRNRALIWIPANQSEINLIDSDDFTADEQWAQLDRFLSTNEYTKDNRGGYAERNGDFGPWSTVVDFRFLQDIPLANAGKHKLQLTFDVFNFTNLINKKWGRRLFIPGQYEIISFEGFAEGTNNVPEYIFDPSVLNEDGEIDPFLDDSGIQSSRWQGQIGLRYIFK